MSTFSFSRRACALAVLVSCSFGAVSCKKDKVEPAAPVTDFDRLGGKAGITNIVNLFFTDLRNELLKPVPDTALARIHKESFARTAPDAREFAFRNNLIDQLGSASISGGPLVYNGKDMHRAHVGMHISPYAFGQEAGLLKTAFVKKQVPTAVIDSVFSHLGLLQASVMNH